MTNLVLDVDVRSVVDEKSHDVHVVVNQSVQDGQMQRRPAVLHSTNHTRRSTA